MVLAGGIWSVATEASAISFLISDLFPTSAYIQIAAGAVVVLLSFFGCCGEIKKVKCVLVIVSESIRLSIMGS